MGLCQGYCFKVLLGFCLYKVRSMLVWCSFLTMHFLLSFAFYLCILTLQCSNCVNEFHHRVSSMWPTPYLKVGNGSSEEDQVHVIYYFLLICLCFAPRALHFALSCALSFVTYPFTILCIPCLCVCAHCWNAKKIRDV